MKGSEVCVVQVVSGPYFRVPCIGIGVHETLLRSGFCFVLLCVISIQHLKRECVGSAPRNVCQSYRANIAVFSSVRVVGIWGGEVRL